MNPDRVQAAPGIALTVFMESIFWNDWPADSAL
jgi:hypothetical protein